jgi:two-component system, NarL family, response regulator LiaR
MTDGRVTVLLADDHDMVREGIRRVLSTQRDVEVVGEVEDGLAAVAAVERLRPDVVFLDITMPALNGVSAAQRITALGGPTKVIALSMHVEAEFVSSMLAAGASGYLLKNTAARELVTALRAVLRGDTYLSPKAAEVAPQTERSHRPRVLSDREREVLQLLAEGKSNKEIADVLRLGTRTVETHRAQIMEKLGVRSVAALTKYAIRHGLSPME